MSTARFPLPRPATQEWGEGQGEGLVCCRNFSILAPMNPTANARRLFGLGAIG